MKVHILKAGVVLLVALLTACGNKQQIAMPMVETSNPFLVTIKVPLTTAQIKTGKKAGWETVSGLFVFDNNTIATQPVYCNYKVKDDTLYYTPQQPLGASMEFIIKVCGSNDTLTQKISTPEYSSASQAPNVEAVYPIETIIPSNILMFHVIFTEPMVEDNQAYKQVKLLNDKGEEMQFVWRQKSNWTDDGKHLVMMLHPGRVKRDIRYFEEGDVLFEPGKKYTLVITAALKDRNNRTLEKEFRKEFTIGGPDRTIPTVNSKNLILPKAGTKAPIEITFNEGMDYGTLLIGLNMINSKGEKVEGVIAAKNDKNWIFTPKLAWEATTYSLQLNDYVSDMAGNHLTRRFEETDIEEMKKRDPVIIEFTAGK